MTTLTPFPVTRTATTGTQTVLTYRQWTEAYDDYHANKYPDATSADRADTGALNANHHAWLNAIVAAYDDGAHIPTRILRTLDPGMLYRLGRTTRALRSAAALRDLTARMSR
jgi:hypothetical protein